VEGTIRSTESSATPATLFAVAADLLAYPEWAAGVSRVEVLEMDDAGRPRRAFFEIDGFIRKITYVLEYTFDPPHLIAWRAEPGEDIEAMEGSYRFEPLDGDGSEILYALRVQPAFPVPGFLRRQAEQQIVKAALRGLKQRAEALEAGTA